MNIEKGRQLKKNLKKIKYFFLSAGPLSDRICNWADNLLPQIGRLLYSIWRKKAQKVTNTYFTSTVPILVLHPRSRGAMLLFDMTIILQFAIT